MPTNIWAERIGRHELNPSLHVVLQQDIKVHEMVEGLLICINLSSGLPPPTFHL
jgi:hypothetical protein